MKKVAIITGVSSGLGLATANYFSTKGYIVYGIARTPLKGKDFICFACDITNYAEVDKTFKYVYQKEGQIDVLVNFASYSMYGLIEDTSPEEINKIISTNLSATATLCSKVVPYMKKNIEAKIINIVDLHAYIHRPYSAIYQATKAAVDALSISLNNELTKYNIHVISLSPAVSKTLFANNAKLIVNEDNPKQYLANAYYNKFKDRTINGIDPIITARAIYNISLKKNPPIRYVVGFKNKFKYLCYRILPTRLINYIIRNNNRFEIKEVEEDED